MIHFKPEVRTTPDIAVALAIMVADEVFQRWGQDVWITSLNDGKQHKTDSFHYRDAAVDLRIKHVPEKDREELYYELKGRLAPQYQVLWEYKGTEHEHLHVQYNPPKES